MILDALLAAGAPIDTRSDSAGTPIDLARHYNKVWAVQRLQRALDGR